MASATLNNYGENMGVRLGDVLKDLRSKTFRGNGVSKYYPKDSTDAYYRMLYSPTRMEIHHKSPWSSPEEIITVQYEENDMEVQAVGFHNNGRYYKTVTAADIPRTNDGLSIMIKYLFLDPRFALRCAEDVGRLVIEEPGECHAITVLDIPAFGKVVCDFFTNNEYQLTKMRIHKFLLGKELYSQNMDVIFSMPA